MIIINETVCRRIVHYRNKCNLTREDLASNVGVNLKHLISIEAGSRIPRISELVQLAAGLGVSINDLVNNE
ncbi:putative transcriptional regulator [Desulfosporosinus meridiei DSM 13257]|uniref:Putative transcriptional regulator n=1 Tax=Desulfosporosinus meridiei (strain ATCC BAA-275 / DSM 13257 / KCTC 12902 / NCIMB 13706 / S10) TaxID=768704 RepID=J7IUZ6_DESMD|nr:putative transcriptional regulator [Desulfosporosinus meridiei DSM 13257]